MNKIVEDSPKNDNKCYTEHELATNIFTLFTQKKNKKNRR